MSAGDGAEQSGAAGGRRYPVGPVVLLAVAAGLMWVASRMTWVTVTSSDGLTEPRTDELNGGTWFGALTPLALVLLAAVAAVFATRGWLRRFLGVLVTLVAAVTAVPPFALLTGSGDPGRRGATLAELPGRATVTDVQTAVLPALITLAAALAAFTAGVLLARMPRESADLSGRYDAPAVRRAAAGAELDKARAGEDADLTERVLWDALDAGDDPTADPPPARSPAEPSGDAASGTAASPEPDPAGSAAVRREPDAGASSAARREQAPEDAAGGTPAGDRPRSQGAE